MLILHSTPGLQGMLTALLCGKKQKGINKLEKVETSSRFILMFPYTHVKRRGTALTARYFQMAHLCLDWRMRGGY